MAKTLVARNFLAGRQLGNLITSPNLISIGGCSSTGAAECVLTPPK